MGGRDGHRRLLRGDPARTVDAGDRGTDRRPPRPQARCARLLRAGVMEDGAVRRSVSGTPQGGVVSPLLCNVYLHRLDRAWQTRGHGVLVRYADDLVVMCRTEAEAQRALAALRALLAELGLEPKQAKTRIVHLREGGEGFDFLGFHHRYVRGRTRRSRHLTFLARWPSRQAMQHARDRIRELTARERLLLSGRRGRAGRQPRSCAAGRATSATETRPAPSTRSRATRSCGSRSSWPSAIRCRRVTAGRWSPTSRRTGWA